MRGIFLNIRGSIQRKAFKIQTNQRLTYVGSSRKSLPIFNWKRTPTNYWHVSNETQEQLAHCTRNTRTAGTLHKKHKNCWHTAQETQELLVHCTRNTRNIGTEHIEHRKY